MKSQVSWKVGGQQGEGIESTGEIFATAMNRKGTTYTVTDISQAELKAVIPIIKLEYQQSQFMLLVMI